VAIIKKKLRLNVSLHTLLQILSLTLFEKLPLKQAVAGVEPIEPNPAFYRHAGISIHQQRTRRAVSLSAVKPDSSQAAKLFGSKGRLGCGD
jgi:hypothetical protein